MDTHDRNTPERTGDCADGRRAFILGAAALGAGLAAGCSSEPPPKPGRSEGRITAPGQFITSDGAMLNFIESGSGTPLVLIPGWSQTAAMFRAQIDAFSETHRVIAVDMRGHGESSKTSYGYRIARLAMDVRELLDALDLDNVTIAGHSMGCSVIWSYWDLFGGYKIARMVLVDQAPTVVFWPGWTDEEKQTAGALFDAKGLYDTAAGIAGDDDAKVTEGVIKDLFFTKSYPEDNLDFVLSENLKFPRQHAARLLVDHCTQDWRDIIPRINVPTLVVGGKASFFHPKSQEWIASQIVGAQVEIFEADEGGGHFMFMENPEKFNAILKNFLA
ncbi:MAG: alpha/beta hydrolase [Burkholderiales bacterium]